MRSYRDTTLLFFHCYPNNQTWTLQYIIGINWTDTFVINNLQWNHCSILCMRCRQSERTFHSSLSRIWLHQRCQAVINYNVGHMRYWSVMIEMSNVKWNVKNLKYELYIHIYLYYSYYIFLIINVCLIIGKYIEFAFPSFFGSVSIYIVFYS